MQAAARTWTWRWRWRCFHSTAAVLSKSTPHIRFAVREKRADAKAALKNILLNGGPCQEGSNKQKRQQKGSGRSKLTNSSYGKNPHRKGKSAQKWKNFDEDDCSDTPYGNFGGKRSFTWYWPGEDDQSGSPSGFQWQDESQSNKSRERVWNESDVDGEEPCYDNLRSHRISLGLPPLGPLELDHIKSAFRASALKWHPDKHQGASQAEAEEKFKRCVEAYKALSVAFKPSD
uniref:J domain-containing protein n=1 Tax=Oryza meridionalis TaxID=40149 RepID=A0A0E0DKW6_9ORYZ